MDNDIHKLAEIINFPGSERDRSVKAIGKYMIDKSPILGYYFTMVMQSKNNNPYCYAERF